MKGCWKSRTLCIKYTQAGTEQPLMFSMSLAWRPRTILLLLGEGGAVERERDE
jgi:hypothetical protein